MRFRKYITALAAALAAGLVLAVFLLLSSGSGTDLTVNEKTRLHSGESPQPSVEGNPVLPLNPVGTGQADAGGTVRNETRTTGGDTMSMKSTTRIKMTFGNEEIFFRISDSPAGGAFLAQLPLTLTFKDYAGTEKISYLPKKLPTTDAPAGSDPSIGDIAYYSPWGNLAMYYRDFGYSDGLIILGSAEPSGAEKLGRMNSDFTAVLETSD